MIKPLDFLFYIIGLIGTVSIVIAVVLFFSWRKERNEYMKNDDIADSQNFFLVGIGLVVIVLVLIGVD